MNRQRNVFTLAFFFIAACLAVAAASGVTAAPLDTSQLKADKCLDMRSYYGSSHVLCGRLPVREGADIELAIVVITPEDAEAAKRTPTIFVHGGPGSGVVKSWVSMEGEPYVQAGPFILFDQRGVGQSTPRLCPDIDEPKDDAVVQDPLKVAERDVADCLSEATKAKVDLNAYGTDATVRDMEEIRQALRIDRWNVMGVSYGTTVTLAYLAAHADRTAAAVLDSVYPPETAGMTNLVPAAVASLQSLAALCAAQPRCGARFGDVRAAAEEAFRSLEASPFRLRPDSDGDERVLTSDILFSIVQGSLMDAAAWYALPRFIDDVRKRRETALVDAVYDTFAGPSSGSGVWYATECRERAPFDRLHAGDDPRFPALTRAAGADNWLIACAKWPAKLATNWQTPRDVDVPTLVVAGALDPVTPSADARTTAERLGQKARLLIVPNGSHSVSSSFPCVKERIASFLRGSIVGVLCKDAAAPPEFATDLVTFDIDEAPGRLLSDLGVPTPSFWVTLADIGLLSSLLWPIAAIGFATGAARGPFWGRSSVWLASSAVLLLLWEAGRSVAAANTGPLTTSWSYYGVPTHTWPAFSLIVPAMATSLAGAIATYAEIKRQALRPVEIAHRAWVIAGLGLAFAVVLHAGAVPSSFSQVMDDAAVVRRLLPW